MRKCGYWREKARSSSVSNSPVGDRGISLDLRVLLELCILTAIRMELRSGSRELKMESRAMVRLHSLGIQLGGVRSTSQVANSFIGTGAPGT